MIVAVGRRGQPWCIIMYLRICMCTNTFILMFNTRQTSGIHISDAHFECMDSGHKENTSPVIAQMTVRRMRVLIRNMARLIRSQNRFFQVHAVDFQSLEALRCTPRSHLFNLIVTYILPPWPADSRTHSGSCVCIGRRFCHRGLAEEARSWRIRYMAEPRLCLLKPDLDSNLH